MEELKETKKEFVPEDGQILKKTPVSFTTGESVFDILKTICGEKGIQISSKYTPLYDSYYVEGINQLYELDCGKNSGWMYSVNGTFPNYGASAYKPKDGDVILETMWEIPIRETKNSRVSPTGSKPLILQKDS